MCDKRKPRCKLAFESQTERTVTGRVPHEASSPFVDFSDDAEGKETGNFPETELHLHKNTCFAFAFSVQ